MYKKLFLIFLITPSYGSTDNYTFVTDLLQNYTRTVTILEIGKKQLPWLFSLAKKKTVCVGLFMEGQAENALKKTEKERYNNVILLAPSIMTPNTFKRLGSCEHFDIVIIHDISLSACLYAHTADIFLHLGDHIFIETAHHYAQNAYKEKKMTLLASKNETMLFYAHKKKTDLTNAHFSLNDHDNNYKKGSLKRYKPEYSVITTFSTKLFYKPTLKEALPWINGINVVTFSLLGGFFPTDRCIRNQIATFSQTYPEHNDLVLSNLIVTGKRLVPIDFDDKRRNAPLTKCIAAAHEAFKEGNNRLKDPVAWLDGYYRHLY